MKNYLDLGKEILETGTWQSNRTGTDAISLPGAMLKFDLSNGFPLMTTKKLAVQGMIGEFIGFMRGAESAEDFRNLSCNFWNADANQNKDWLRNPNRKGEDDLGRIYGAQWRGWRSEQIAPGMYGCIDQVQQALDLIAHNPTSRRIIINAWNPAELNQMALPPCHVLYQFIVNVERKELNLCMYQRSCDMFLGVPMNIASSALFLSVMARLTGYKPRFFTHFLADAHIYRNHVKQVEEQISRTPFSLPRLMISDTLVDIDRLHPEMFKLEGYECHPAIQGVMATTMR